MGLCINLYNLYNLNINCKICYYIINILEVSFFDFIGLFCLIFLWKIFC